jgi:HEAT repeat protein
MRRYLSAVLALLLYACTAPAQSAQNLAARIAAAPDGTVGFAYPARASVCGDGRSFIMEITGPHSQNIYHAEGGFTNIGGDFVGRCVEGPVRIVLDKRDGQITGLYPYVGGSNARAVRTDLGSVTAQEAADYLLNLARRVPRLASEAFMTASLGDGARISVTLLEHARDQRVHADVRASAVKWIGRTTEREGTVDQVMPVLRNITANSEEHLNVRERALRALGELPRGANEVRDIYARLDRAEMRERAVRIFAEIGGDANTTIIQRIALDPAERDQVRERAVRVLGEELGRLDIVRQLYSRLDRVTLRERAVRSVGDHLTSESAQWLRSLAENASEDRQIRDRAIRTLAEAGYTTQLRSLYGRLNIVELKERIIRAAAEHGSQDDTRWIEQIAMDEREAEQLRERAVRVLAEESGVPTARLVAIYDGVTPYSLRERVLRLLGERGDEAAIDKLIKVARSGEEDLRRRAIRLLAESSDPRAREFLRATVTR